MRYHSLIVLVLAQVAYGLLYNPSVINYGSFNFTEYLDIPVFSQMTVDDTATSIFALVADNDRDGWFNITNLIIMKLDPQFGDVIEDSAIVIPLGTISEDGHLSIESPLPNKVAVMVDGTCDVDEPTSFVLIFNIDGILEQNISLNGSFYMKRPYMPADSPLHSSLFIITACSDYFNTIPEVTVLVWDGTQFTLQNYTYINLLTHEIVGDFIYGVTLDNQTQICQFELQNIFVGNYEPVACQPSPNGDITEIQYIFASPSGNRLGWYYMFGYINITERILDIKESMIFYDIPSFTELGVIQEPLQNGGIDVRVRLQLSEFGDLLFAGMGDFSSFFQPLFEFKDISELPITQPFYPAPYPPFLTHTEGAYGRYTMTFVYGVITRDAKYTFTCIWVEQLGMYYIVGYDSTPTMVPDVVSSMNALYTDLIADTKRGYIWALNETDSEFHIDAIALGSSYESFTAHVNVEHGNCTVGQFFSWYITTSSTDESLYLVLDGNVSTCIYDIHDYPNQNVTLVATLPFLWNGYSQLTWISGEPFIIRVGITPETDSLICIYNATNDPSCQPIVLPYAGSSGFHDPLKQWSLGVATPNEFDVMVLGLISEFQGTMLYNYPINATFDFGSPTTTALLENCTFLNSKVLFNDELWFSCVSMEDNQYIIYQFDCITQTIGCSVPAGEYAPNAFAWTLRDDGQYLGISTPAQSTVYDISSCHQHVNATSYPELRSIYALRDTYYQMVLFEVSTANVQVALASRSIALIADCQDGMQPNADNFCSKCPPGTSGPMCQVCPGGFICADYGTIVANEPCPPGYYCVLGTNSSTLDIEGGPAPCIAGTYCPLGVSRKDVDLQDNLSPRWCPQGYYCPEGSSKANPKECPGNSTTKGVGGASADDCWCNEGFWGVAGVCKECPSVCTCYDNVVSGCFIDGDDIIMCAPYTMNGTTPCNPGQQGWNGTENFPCAPGFTGRLCSKCMPNHYMNGRECVMCSDSLSWKLPLAYGALGTLIMIVAWTDKPGSSAVFSILAFHFQTLFALITGGNQWHIFVAQFLNYPQEASSFSLKAIECIVPWWSLEVKLYYYMALPLGYFGLILIAVVAALIFNKIFFPQIRGYDYYKLRAAKMMVFLYRFNFFSVIMVIFGFLAPSHGHFTVYPWMKYSDKLALVAMGGLIVEGIMIPVAIAITIWKRRKVLGDVWVKGVFGCLYSIYVPSNYYWEFVILARRVAIAAIITFSPYNSPVLMIGTFATVQIYMMLQMNNKPYVRRADNIIETASHFVLSCTLAISLMVGYPNLREFVEGMVYSAAALNTIFAVTGLLYTLYSIKDQTSSMLKAYFQRISRLCGRKPEARALLNSDEIAADE